MSGRLRRPSNINPLKMISFLLIFSCLLYKTRAIDWDSDIVPTNDELENAKRDALSMYFGKDVENDKLFRSFKSMDKLVGKHIDVPIER